jgi:hypothetical protein
MRMSTITRLILTLAVVLSLGSVSSAMADWQPGPDAILDNTYSGAIDLPANGSTVPSDQSLTVSGWVVDGAAEGWAGIDNVHVYDGLAGQGGTFLGQASFAQYRPDVAQGLGNPFWANSGFALTLNPGTLAAGSHTLTVYAHTPAKGWWFMQTSVTAAPPAPAPPAVPVAAAAGPVNVLVRPSTVTVSKQEDHYSIKGYALEPNAPGDTTGIDHVDLYMDELRGTGGSVLIGRAALGQDSPEAVASFGTRFEKAGYQLDFKPTNFNVGSHHIYAYAVSAISGKETIAVTGFTIGP